MTGESTTISLWESKVIYTRYGNYFLVKTTDKSYKIYENKYYLWLNVVNNERLYNDPDVLASGGRTFDGDIEDGRKFYRRCKNPL